MRPSNPFRSFLVATLGILAVLLAGELAVRTWVASPSLAIPDARFGWRYPPHARVVFSAEGYSVRRTNSLGFLDDEPREPRPRFRALLLGDSFVEALQVPAGQGFADVAERSLPGLEVVNAGLSGRSPVDHADQADLLAPRLAPDAIVVQLTDGDLGDLLRPGVAARLAHPPVPGVEEPPLVERVPVRLAREVMRRSALVTLARHRIELLVKDQGERLSRRFREASARPDADADGPVSDPRIPAILDSVHARLAVHTPRIVLVYIPLLEYTEPGCPVARPAGRALMHAFADRHGLPMVDVADAFRAEFERTGQPCHGFANSVMGSGHINARGHRIVGEALARQLAPAVR